MIPWKRIHRVGPFVERCALLMALALCIAVDVAAQTPSISKVQPLAVRPGQTNEVRLSGQNLSGPTALWMSFPAVSLAPKLDAAPASTEVVWRAEVPKAAPPGIGAFRLATTNGVTPLQLFMVDDLATVQESTTNKTTAAAQPIQWPGAVDGQTDEITFDYFKFNAKKGEQVSIEVVAQRLGSRLDPVLRVLDKEGREVAYCDDDARVGRDSRLRLKLPSAGSYIVEVRDINYGGGSAFFYRLRVGDFPLAAMPFPPVVPSGTNATIKVLSGEDKALAEVKAQIPTGAARVSVPVRTRRVGGSSFVSLLAAGRAPTLEKEPNNASNSATLITVPCGVSGRFEQTSDVDMFRFAAGKDQKLVFRARNRSLGSPCDLFMSIQDMSGATVAEYDPTAPDEGTITNTFKSAGDFFLIVEELNQGAGPDLGYHIDIDPLQPGFALSVDSSELQGRAGETVSTKVTAVRREYDGPIELSLESPVALKTESSTIPEKKNEVEMKIHLPTELSPGSWLPLKITGRADIGGREEKVTVSTLPALRKLWPNLRHFPVDLDGLMAIGVRSAQATPAESKAKDKNQE